MTEGVPEKILKDQCHDPTQSLTIELPCRMIERVEKYAREKGTIAAGVFIEALDDFLRRTDQ